MSETAPLSEIVPKNISDEVEVNAYSETYG